MAELRYEPFRKNRRIQSAAENAPPMKPGEGDVEAVRVLQHALIDAGFSIPDGPTGNYGRETMAAVQALERRWSLMSDTGIAGRQVFERLDALLAKTPVIVVPPAILRVVLQTTNTNGGFVHRMYFATAPLLLGQHQMRIGFLDRREPQIEISGGTVDPSSMVDIAGVREAAEKHTSGLPDQLRVIFCRFRGFAGGGAERFYASTEGGSKLPSILSRIAFRISSSDKCETPEE